MKNKRAGNQIIERISMLDKEVMEKIWPSILIETSLLSLPKFTSLWYDLQQTHQPGDHSSFPLGNMKPTFPNLAFSSM